MAVIIDRSDRSLADKHQAWQELIEFYPDMPAPPNYHDVRFASVHDRIAARIAYERLAIARFKEPENGAFYQYCDLNFSHETFTTFEKAIVNWKEYREDIADEPGKWWNNYEPIFGFQRIIPDHGSKIHVTSDDEGTLYEIHVFATDEDRAKWFPGFEHQWESGINNSCHWHGYEFAELFFIDIPIPFKRGDILTNPGSVDPVFVLESAPEDPKVIAWYERSLRGEISDGWDMQLWCYFVHDSGVLTHEHDGGYDAFEYFRGELKGKYRLLHYVSLYLADKIGLEQLLTMQCRLILEHANDHLFKFWVDGYCWFPAKLLYENRNNKESNTKGEGE
jgi:hypothetical protein